MESDIAKPDAVEMDVVGVNDIQSDMSRLFTVTADFLFALRCKMSKFLTTVALCFAQVPRWRLRSLIGRKCD